MSSLIRVHPWLVSLLSVAVCTADDHAPSPSGNLFAHYTLCSQQNPCTPEVVITSRAGAEVHRFQVRDDDGPCMSILDVHWAGEKTVGATCHGNPSLNDYFEVDIASGRILRQYLGYRFVRSPDYSKVAHVGWIIHFAPPWVKGEYLQIGNTVIYPLPPGTKPVELKRLERPPEVVATRGLVYAGVHEFRSRFVWSPDSRNIGLIDCVVDYRLRDDSPEAFNEGGEQENLRCFAVAVGLDGTFRRVVVPPTSGREATLRWTDGRTFVVTVDGNSVTVRTPR